MLQQCECESGVYRLGPALIRHRHLKGQDFGVHCQSPGKRICCGSVIFLFPEGRPQVAPGPFMIGNVLKQFFVDSNGFVQSALILKSQSQVSDC